MSESAQPPSPPPPPPPPPQRDPTERIKESRDPQRAAIDPIGLAIQNRNANTSMSNRQLMILPRRAFLFARAELWLKQIPA